MFCPSRWLGCSQVENFLSNLIMKMVMALWMGEGHDHLWREVIVTQFRES